MPGKRMLRDMMSVNDIYSYAETIIELLREEYGSYDADTLDEVQVEERFAQRLQARGYEVRSPGEAAPAPAPAPTPAPAPVGLIQDTPIVPVTVVRTRRATSGSSGTGSSTSGGTTRGRRTTTSGDGTRSSAASESSRASSESARPTPESSADSSGDSSASSSETSSRPARQRRIVRPRTNNNGDTSS